MIRPAFNRAGAKPEGPSGIDFLEAILRERPDLREQTTYFPEQGMCGHTVMIGNEVFKGPKEAKFVAQFDNEHQVMRGMEGKGLPVPEVTCVGKETLFFGMKKMPGNQLALGFFVNRPEDEQRQLAKDIARFVAGMAAAFPLREDGRFMIHGDMNLGNFLIDPKTMRLSGVVDFGLSAYLGETGIMQAHGAVIKNPDEWLPCLRDGSKVMHEKLQEFNEMLHAEYRALRKRAPSPKKSPAFKA